MNKYIIFTFILTFFTCELNAQKTYEQDEDKAINLYNKGLSFLMDDKHKEAVKYFEESAKYDSTSYLNYYNWGVTLAELAGDSDTSLMKMAVEKIKAAVRNNDGNNDGFKLVMAKILSRLARATANEIYFEESMEMYKAAGESFEDKSFYFSEWGISMMQFCIQNNTLPRYENHLATLFHKAYDRIEPNNATYNMACMYSLLGKKDLALIWLEEAILINDLEKDIIVLDKNFDAIRNDDDYIKLIDKYYNKEIEQTHEHYVVNNDDSLKAIPPLWLEKAPIFRGNDTALIEFIKDNIEIPLDGVKYGVKGTVEVRFIVDKDGSVKKPKVISSIYKGSAAEPYNNEALRIISIMPKWNPGIVNNEAVATYSTVPVNFESDGKFAWVYKDCIVDSVIINEDYKLVFLAGNPDAFNDYLYTRPRLIHGGKMYKIEGYEEYFLSGKMVAVSPDGKFFYMDRILADYIIKDGELYERYFGCIVDVENHTLVWGCQSDDCNGEWNNNNKWINPDTREIIFDPVKKEE